MFIKKDLRKISEILSDPDDSREYLKLSKRSFEFQSTVQIICTEANIPALKSLKVLNLYDNCINDLEVTFDLIYSFVSFLFYYILCAL